MRCKALAAIIMGILGFVTQLFAQTKVPDSIYEFTINSLDGKPISFDQFKGKTLLIVNTASRCSYTGQYEDLQKLHEQFGDKVTILGFPANNFLWQEPGSNTDIASFCQKNYGVTFQMFEKVSVKGHNAHPLYKWLYRQSGRKPSWNFCKYVIDKNGRVVGFYGSKTNPLDEAIIKKISE